MTFETVNNLPLPHTIRVLAEIAGIDAAMKIALRRRGTRFRIPEKSEGSLLEKIVGPESAQQIVDELSNEVFEIPLIKKPLAFWLRQKGYPIETIALRLGLSRRTLQYWFNKPPERPEDA